MTETKKKQERLPKLKPDPKLYRKLHGRFEFTERDFEILDLVLRHRYLTAQQIKVMFNRKRSPGRDRKLHDRLQGLFHEEYVQRLLPVPPMTLQSGSRPQILVLKRKGAKTVCDWRSSKDGKDYTIPERGKPKQSDVRWRPEYARRQQTKLIHDVVVSETMLALELAIEKRPDFQIAHRSLTGEFVVDLQVAGQKKQPKLVPDAYVFVNQPGGAQNWFFEIDRSNEESEYVKEKYLKYLMMLDTEEWQDYPNHEKVRVCFVTTHLERLQNMRAYLDQLKLSKKEASIFWFTTDERFSVDEPDRILFDMIWQNATLPGGLSLAKPKNSSLAK